MNQAPGKMYLQITGILLIVGAAFSIIGSLLIILGGGVAASGTMGFGADSQGDGVLLVGIGVFTLIVGVFDLIVGICGVKNCNKPEKAALCVKLGIALIVLSMLSSLLNLISDFSVTGVLSLFAGLVVPVLYVVGAKKNQAANTTSVQ